MGIAGWHYGVLRKDAFGKMLDRLQNLQSGIVRGGMAYE